MDINVRIILPQIPCHRTKRSETKDPKYNLKWNLSLSKSCAVPPGKSQSREIPPGPTKSQVPSDFRIHVSPPNFPTLITLSPWPGNGRADSSDRSQHFLPRKSIRSHQYYPPKDYFWYFPVGQIGKSDGTRWLVFDSFRRGGAKIRGSDTCTSLMSKSVRCRRTHKASSARSVSKMSEPSPRLRL